MTPPIFDGIASQSPGGSPPSTGTGGTEGDTAQNFYVEGGSVLFDANAVDGDGVKQDRKCARCEHPQGWHFHGSGSCLECGCTGFTTWSEQARVAFLRRAQQEGNR